MNWESFRDLCSQMTSIGSKCICSNHELATAAVSGYSNYFSYLEIPENAFILSCEESGYFPVMNRCSLDAKNK